MQEMNIRPEKAVCRMEVLQPAPGKGKNEECNAATPIAKSKNMIMKLNY